jgi:hypothetical protein
LLRKEAVVLAFIVLIAIKVALAMTTPPSSPVIYYLEAQRYPHTPEAGNPWGRLDNFSLGVWYALPVDHPDLEVLLTNTSLTLPYSIQLLLLIVKLPLLLADLLVAVVLFLLARNLWPLSRMPLIALVLWLANPYVTFVTEMLGAVDVVPVACMMVALLLLTKRQRLLSNLGLAAGIAIKLFPIVALPVFLYSSSAGTRVMRAVRFVVAGILAVIALWAYSAWSGFPFSEAYYTQSTTQLILPPQSFYGFSPPVDFIGLASLSVIFSYLYIAYRYPHMFSKNPVAVTLLAMLAFLCFIDVQVEYVLWVIPLFVIVNLAEKRTIFPFVCILASAFSLGFFTSDGYATQSGWSLLFFSSPSDWANMVLSSPLVDIVVRPVLRTSISIFAIICMLMVWSSFVANSNHATHNEPNGESPLNGGGKFC